MWSSGALPPPEDRVPLDPPLAPSSGCTNVDSGIINDWWRRCILDASESDIAIASLGFFDYHVAEVSFPPQWLPPRTLSTSLRLLFKISLKTSLAPESRNELLYAVMGRSFFAMYLLKSIYLCRHALGPGEMVCLCRKNGAIRTSSSVWILLGEFFEEADSLNISLADREDNQARG